MGVYRTDYIMLAHRILNIEERNNLFLSKFGDIDTIDNPYEDNAYSQEKVSYNGLTMVSDGLCGNYCFIGKVLVKVVDFENGIPMYDGSRNPAKDYMKDIVIDTLKQEFNIEYPDVRLWVFSHYH